MSATVDRNVYDAVVQDLADAAAREQSLRDQLAAETKGAHGLMQKMRRQYRKVLQCSCFHTSIFVMSDDVLCPGVRRES